MMLRFAVALALWAVFGSSGAHAAAADLYTVSGVAVDATAESATLAYDQAVAEGRPIAWQRLFRRLTPQSVWPRQPQLDDAALQRMIRAIEIVNGRRSTTRYVGEITYHFNGAEVQRALRAAGVPYAETQAKPMLVIPIINGKVDLMGPWARAWTNPGIAQGLVPVILPTGDAEDQALLSRPDLTQLDWAALQPLIRRYGVTQVVMATATPEGNASQLVVINPTGRQTESLAFARSTFGATADASAMKIAEGWKDRSAVDYGQRGRIQVDVEFRSVEEWARIRNQLAAVRSVTDVDLLGLSLNEARLEISYFGRPEQLPEVMIQQNLDFKPVGRGGYTLELATAAALAAP